MAFFEIPKLKSNQGINFVFISKLLFVLSYVVEFVKQLLFILTYTYMPLFEKKHIAARLVIKCVTVIKPTEARTLINHSNPFS